MAEFIEVRATIEGHERAAVLANDILRAGLATSIDIAETPRPASRHDAISWELTLITTAGQAPALERHIWATGLECAIVSRPIVTDLDGPPDWLNDERI
ncbi:hypothetical protein [Nonomuraea diastatica]|uniref:Divalent-cation tolerance protein CutA n=1 Tax=Nonomuraea diastatica TaxID=1848329 RepID=A0A4R4X2B4_9ACTN|nr:hypothetical protein [Nonomuraea diastatica]TDD24350.1 hypothetical protein E1294_06335 [Nonomuraea diastatica]